MHILYIAFLHLYVTYMYIFVHWMFIFITFVYVWTYNVYMCISMQSYAIVMPLVTTPYRLSYSKHGHCNNCFAFFSNYYYLQ